MQPAICPTGAVVRGRPGHTAIAEERGRADATRYLPNGRRCERVLRYRGEQGCPAIARATICAALFCHTAIAEEGLTAIAEEGLTVDSLAIAEEVHSNPAPVLSRGFPRTQVFGPREHRCSGPANAGVRTPQTQVFGPRERKCCLASRDLPVAASAPLSQCNGPGE